jgi:4-aminobutyrate aminotransferase/(S)-3-amino-2-methylpropionate transaminase
MIAFELTRAGTTEPLSGSAASLSEHAARHGVVLITAGTDGNVIRFLPTLDVTDDLLEYALTVVEDALNRQK